MIEQLGNKPNPNRLQRYAQNGTAVIAAVATLAACTSSGESRPERLPAGYSVEGRKAPPEKFEPASGQQEAIVCRGLWQAWERRSGTSRVILNPVVDEQNNVMELQDISSKGATFGGVVRVSAQKWIDGAGKEQLPKCEKQKVYTTYWTQPNGKGSYVLSLNNKKSARGPLNMITAYTNEVVRHDYGDGLNAVAAAGLIEGYREALRG